jgi:hypothetical protein
VILRQDDNVALIERVRGGKTYHLFPVGHLADRAEPLRIIE